MALSMGDTVMHKTVNSPVVTSTNVTVGEKDGNQINKLCIEKGKKVSLSLRVPTTCDPSLDSHSSQPPWRGCLQKKSLPIMEPEGALHL